MVQCHNQDIDVDILFRILQFDLDSFTYVLSCIHSQDTKQFQVHNSICCSYLTLYLPSLPN